MRHKLIQEAKPSYYTNLGSKLSDPISGQICSWIAYKKIVNKKNITNSPPIIDNGIYISTCKEKADIFKEYFANQCTINDNDNVLPGHTFKIEVLFSYVFITRNHLIKVIDTFDANKAHGYGGISVSMLKLCDAKVALYHQMIFSDCVNSGMFPDNWKYANVQPINKKDNRQIKGNNRPISLLPICRKILEK